MREAALASWTNRRIVAVSRIASRLRTLIASGRSITAWRALHRGGPAATHHPAAALADVAPEEGAPGGGRAEQFVVFVRAGAAHLEGGAGAARRRQHANPGRTRRSLDARRGGTGRGPRRR